MAFVDKYSDIINLKLDFAQKGFEAVSYYIDFPSTAGRNLVSSPIAYEDIGTLLPSDISGLSRKIPSNSRNAFAISEISLADELKFLSEEFEANLKTFIPNPARALTLPYVEEVDNGFLLGHEFISRNSLEGILTIEILNAVADGTDIEELAYALAHELVNNNILRGKILVDNPRAFFMIRGSQYGRWAGGIVRYRWGDISDLHKTAMLSAMDTWATSVGGGKIRLLENSPDDWWTQWQINIYALGVVKIENAILPLGVTGSATVGTMGGQTSLKLAPHITGEQLRRTSLHEFGHTLGLKHEHQRYDRDTFITVTNTDSDFVIVPKTISGLRFHQIRVKVGLWTISVFVPVFWSQDQVWTSNVFDFRSIMIYSGFPIKDTPAARAAGFRHGIDVVPFNSVLSPLDIDAVRRLY
jgi:hypothetical protein